MWAKFLVSVAAISVSAIAVANDSPAAVAPATVKTVGDTLAALDARARSAGDQLKALEHRASELDAFTIARGRSLVRLARAGLLPVGGGFAELVDHAARLEKLRRALERDLAETEAVARDRRRLAKTLSEIDAQRDVLESERSALERSHVAILAAEERDEAFRRAFQSSYGFDHTAVYAGGPSSSAADMGGGFEALKGKVPFPIAGRSEIRHGSRPGAGPGLEMGAALGTVVRPVYPGRVAFADDYPDFGRTVIIDHGGGFFTLSAGLADTEVRPGDDVQIGDSIGRIGPGAALYFEIRHGKTTLDPSPWFGI